MTSVYIRLPIRVLALIGSAAVANTVATAAALAIEANETGGDALAEIVVTAQRRSQPLQEVPVAVSVVSGDSLERANLNTLEAVSARLPDVKIVSGPLTDLLNIRGVGSGQNSGFEQSVGTFVDGIYRGRSKSTRAALFDIDQVEVLKGPQTTFFGNNAIAGALNITTRKPKDSLEYNASTLYTAETGEYDVEGGVGGPLLDTLGVRFSGRASGMNGYVRDWTTGGDAPHNRDYLGRISLRWKPVDKLQTDVRFDLGRSRSRDGVAMTALNCPSPFAAPTDFTCPLLIGARGRPTGSEAIYDSYARPTFTNYDFREAALTNTVDLGPVSLVSLTGDFRHRYDSLVQLIPTPDPGLAGAGLLIAPYRERVHQFSQELRLQSQNSGLLEYMVGAYYSTLSTDIESDIGAYFAPFGAFNPLGTTDATTPVSGTNSDWFRDNTWSGFASLTIRPIDSLRINLGGRYTAVHKVAHRLDTFGAAPGGDFSRYVEFDPVTQIVFSQIFGSELGDFAQPTRTDKKFMPSAGFQYDLSADVMAYFNFARGFKAGGYSGAQVGATFGPEDVDSYEVGVKSQWWDRRLMMNFAVFRSSYKDLQETIITFPGGLPVSTVANAASSRAQGVELSGMFKVSSLLSLSTELAYLDSKYSSYPNGVCTMQETSVLGPACVQNLSGKRRPYSPTFSGNLGATFAIPAGAYQVRIEPLLYFSGRFFTVATADPLLEQSGFAKIDLRVGLSPEDEHWEVAVIGKNLTDRATASYRNPLTAGNGSTFAFPDPPRTVAIQLSVRH